MMNFCSSNMSGYAKVAASYRQSSRFTSSKITRVLYSLGILQKIRLVIHVNPRQLPTYSRG